jgi:hypothetical protein
LNATVGIGGQSTTSNCPNSVAHCCCCWRVRNVFAASQSRQPTLALRV